MKHFDRERNGDLNEKTLNLVAFAEVKLHVFEVSTNRGVLAN